MNKALTLIATLFLTAQISAAQQTVTASTLSGQVKDRREALVSGATVIATNLELHQPFTTSTGYDGKFKFSLLRVGTYSLEIQAQGFEAFTKQLTLTVGQTLDLALTLDVLGVSEKVNVGPETVSIETVRTQVTETIGRTEINDLPHNGRNYLDLAVLIPGVSPTNTGSNQRFAETSAVPGQGISIAGQRNLYNTFVVDGMSANDDAADLTGTYYSEEVIDQFQVVTSGAIAEFGRSSGGVVNILTKSGTNQWKGLLYGFGRNQRFDARSPLAPAKDSLTQAQYGATAGGPLQTDRTFFFTNFEQTRRNYSTIVTIAPTAISTINRQLNLLNYGGPRISTGVSPASFDTTNFFARVDHSASAKHQLAARYSVYHIDAENSRTVGGLNAVSRGSGLNNTDQSAQVNLISTINNHTVNELRTAFTRSRLEAPINDTTGPAISISGVANLGTATSSPVARDIDLFELVENLSTQAGKHSLKTGVDFLYNRVKIDFPGPIQGAYSFSSLNNFLIGNYTSFQQAFGIENQRQSNPNIGTFIQDEWRLRGDLTINAGLRYDLQFLPAPVLTDKNNIAPRVGVAYAPGNRRTVFRATFGLFYDRIPLRATSNALQRDGSKYMVVQFAPSQIGAPVFPNDLSSQPASFVIRPNITTIDPNIEASYSEQVNTQIEHEFTGNTILSVGYLHLRGLHLILSRNMNVPTAPASAGIPNLGRPNPQWGNISRYESSGNSFYDGLVVSLNHRLRSWASVRVSYTLSKTIDDAGNFFFSTVQNNFNIRDDRGLSDNDQRHRLVVSGTLEAPDRFRSALKGFQLGYIFTYASRLPFNVVLGSDRNFDTNNNDRPVGVGRNTGRGFDYSSLDLHLRKEFTLKEGWKLQLIAEGFNMLNRSNLGVPNNTYGAGVVPLITFGQATAAFDARQFQFGIKFSF